MTDNKTSNKPRGEPQKQGATPAKQYNKKQVNRQIDTAVELGFEQKLHELERLLYDTKLKIELKLDAIDNGLFSSNRRLDKIEKNIYYIIKMLKEITSKLNSNESTGEGESG